MDPVVNSSFCHNRKLPVVDDVQWRCDEEEHGRDDGEDGALKGERKVNQRACLERHLCVGLGDRRDGAAKGFHRGEAEKLSPAQWRVGWLALSVS